MEGNNTISNITGYVIHTITSVYMPSSPDQHVRILGYLQLSYCLLSMGGCLFIIFTLLLVNRSPKVHYNFVLGLAFCQLVISFLGFLSYCLGIDGFRIGEHPVLCEIEGALLTIAEKVGLVYVSLITWNMLLQSIGFKEEYLKSKETYIHCITWLGTSLIMVPLLAGKYSSDDAPYAMCSVVKWGWTLVDIYIPIPIFLIFNSAALIYIVIIYNQDFSNFQEVQTRLLRTRSVKKMRSFLWRISFYPCFSLLTYFTLLLSQIFTDWFGPPPVWTYFFAQLVFLEGFLCAIAYGLTPSLRSQFMRFFRAPPNENPTWATQFFYEIPDRNSKITNYST